MSNISPGRMDKAYRGGIGLNSQAVSASHGGPLILDNSKQYSYEHLRAQEKDSSYSVQQQNNIQGSSSGGGYTEFFSWGNDDDGQLGHGQESQSRKRIFNLPKSLSFEVLIKQVSCGVAHTSFISKQGYVFSFGSNVDGQLGISDPSIKFSTAPLLVSDLVNQSITPISISCGGYHTGVITTLGDAYLWGRNLQGQCGRSPNYNQFIFTPSLLHFDSTRITLQSIDCGDQHSAVITRSGQVYAFGDNSEGQIGYSGGDKGIIDRPQFIDRLEEECIQVSCGWRHTLFLTENGKVFGVGSNKKYEMGLGNSSQSHQTKFYIPIQIKPLEMYMISTIKAGSFSAAITSQHELLLWGNLGSDIGVFTSPQKIYLDDTKFTEISLSKSNECFIAVQDMEGALYTWGNNQFGQLGLGDFRQRKVPNKVNQLRKKKVKQVQCGGSFIVAIGRDVSEKEQQQKIKQNQQQQQVRKSSNSQIDQDNGGNQHSFRAKSQSQYNQHPPTSQQINDQRKSRDGLFKNLPQQLDHSQLGNDSYIHSNNDIVGAGNMHQDQSFLRNKRTVSQNMQSEPSISQSQPYYKSPNYQSNSQNTNQQQYNSIQNSNPYFPQNQLADARGRSGGNLGGRTLAEDELSQERIKRRQLEKELKDKDYEIQNLKIQKQTITILEDELNQQIKESDRIRDQLEKEQENSYQILNDLHQSNQEIKLLKEQLDEKSREARSLKEDNKRLVEKYRDGEIELDKSKKEQIFVLQKSETDIKKLQDYLNECEMTIGELRDKQREVERQLVATKEHAKQTEQHLDKQRQEAQDQKRQNIMLQEKIKQLEYTIQQQLKENEDLKYDNTLLYEKNVEKDGKIENNLNSIGNLKEQVEAEKQRGNTLEKELRLKSKQVQELGDLLQCEIDKLKQRERELEEARLERERLRREMDTQYSAKCMDYDNLKRSLEEQQYENENLRRMLHARQEEIASLLQKIDSQNGTENDLNQQIKDLEGLVRDVEEKNKRLVDLLNANIYSKAEQYKEKVLNKLQERQSTATPNKNSNNSLSQLNTSNDYLDRQSLVQPSPIRLQKILTDEKGYAQKERERLQKVAENMNKNQNEQLAGLGAQLSKSNGHPTAPYHNIPPYSAEYQKQKAYTPHQPQFGRETSPSPTRAHTTAGMSAYPQGYGGGEPGQSRLRIQDLQTPSKFGDSSHPGVGSSAFVDLIQQQNQRLKDTSPERIADILKQQSPLRKKLAVESLQSNPMRSSMMNSSLNMNDYTPPGQRGYFRNNSLNNEEDEQQNQDGHIAASKITHTLMQNELHTLKNQYSQMQREKDELEQRLSQYESNISQNRQQR